MMTELEKIKHAKIYLDKLADGIDPISGLTLPDDTALNNVRLSRCFFFVSGILRQVIDNGGTVAGRPRSKSVLPVFVLDEELRNQIQITEEAVMIKSFTERINSLIDIDTMQKLKVTALTSWLVEKGMLCEEIVNDKRRKRPTKAGEELGIFSEQRDGQYGGYLAILYKENAQRYIVKNLDQIIAISNGE